MNTEIAVALIALAGSAGGTLAGIVVSSKLTVYRIEKLEQAMNKHNNFIERVFRIEATLCEVEKDIKEIKEEK